MNLARRRWGFVSVLLVLGVGLVLGLKPTGAVSGSSAVIRLHYATFDPVVGEPLVPIEQRLDLQSDGAATYLVQFAGPVKETWKDGVRETGAQLYGYIPDYAFIARMDAATAARVRSLSFVRWVGAYHPAYRLADTLSTTAEEQTVTVVALPDVELSALQERLEGLGAQVLASWANQEGGFMRATVPAGQVGDLAALDDVLWVEPYLEPELHNDVGGGTIMRASEIRAGLDLYGDGQTVAVCDTGLDTGNPISLSADFRPQFVKAYALGRTGDWSDDDGHGTHVAGSVLGNGTLSGSNPNRHDYAGSYAGVAPEASLVFQSVLDAYGGVRGIPSDLAGLFGPPYNDGARIHTNSWGIAANRYDADAQAADGTMWSRGNLLILFSAGNGGMDGNADGVIDLGSLGSPGTAKNVLTVGASENLRPNHTMTWRSAWPDDYPVDPIARDLLADDADGMAAFSSRGPASDGRLKPDLVAPGTYIYSARSQDPRADTGWGVVNDDYIAMGGTSMSAPLTAGAAALAREWLVKQRDRLDPSAALVKAVLVNGAADMSPGQYGTGRAQEIPATRPNFVTGWGRVDLVESLSPPAPRRIWIEDHRTGVSTNDREEYVLTIGPTSSAFGEASPGLDAAVSTSATRAAPASAPAPGKMPASAGSGSVEPNAVVQMLANTGFEPGTWPPWVTAGNPEITSLVRHTGLRSALLGNRDNANDQFWQRVAIPADATEVTLSFWHRLRTEEYGARADFFCYGIRNETGVVDYVRRCLDLGNEGDVNWTELSYTLADLERLSVQGKTVAVFFSIQNDFSLPSRVWVDDVALNVTTPGELTPTPTATSTGTPTGPTPTSTPSSGTREPFRVTLVWTDRPGSPAAAKALVNDLHLEVIGPDGTRYYGNQGLYAGGHRCLDGQWDTCNNVEGIILPNAAYGTYAVVVRGANVPQGPQPFALVVSGDRIREGGTPPPTRTTTPSPTVTPTGEATPTVTRPVPTLTNHLYMPFVGRE